MSSVSSLSSTSQRFARRPSTYTDFLASLDYPSPRALAPEECPICRAPFLTSTPETRQSPLFFWGSLPFPEHLDTHNDDMNVLEDHPVRLPCEAGHIVGNTCMLTWFSDGGENANTCPLDQQPLFQPSHSYYDRPHRSGNERYNESRRRIEAMPLRELIRRSHAYTASDLVNASSATMTQRLATLLLRVAFRSDQSGLESPRAAALNAVAPPRWPRLTTPIPYGDERSIFTQSIPQRSPHLFTILHRLAHVYQGSTLPAEELTSILQNQVNDFFSNYQQYTNDAHETQLRRFMTTVIDIWVAQELLMTELRTATQTPNRTTYASTLNEFLVGYERGGGDDQSILRTGEFEVLREEWDRRREELLDGENSAVEPLLDDVQEETVCDSERDEEEDEILPEWQEAEILAGWIAFVSGTVRGFDGDHPYEQGFEDSRSLGTSSYLQNDNPRNQGYFNLEAQSTREWEEAFEEGR
ncbi:hypothetical protein K458DRAFT_431022 [Lentithecium fluviatile CBS 122367]|uniref:RING-type domain-containing protein n=1 Tax=Lentithecium fluviatile CBS 122367 TaxID=1168545 RepID=A0A6G1J3B9_9PLEO|nr:hypothetical protein K458DRAFT_431022 [Lentithecium fluviatile CBS 122367]